MNDDDIRVSAVIPTYNRAHLIEDALDSIAAQTRPVDEIVVVDDGSDDGTEGTILAWAAASDIPVKLFLQQRAGGNAARNKGIQEATGTHIAFLDSDDLWHTDKLEKQISVCATFPEFRAIYCGLRETDVSSGAIIGIPERTYPQGDLNALLLINDVTTPTSCYLVERRLLLDLGGFDIELEARQDWDMWIRVSEQTKIGCVPEPLVDLRHHSGPRTASDPTRELKAYRKILSKYAPERKKYGWRVQLPALASYHRRVGRVRIRYQSKWFSGIGHYFLAIAIWPLAPDSWAALLGALLPVGLRAPLRKRWNSVFGRTAFAIRNH